MLAAARRAAAAAVARWRWVQRVRGCRCYAPLRRGCACPPLVSRAAGSSGPPGGCFDNRRGGGGRVSVPNGRGGSRRARGEGLRAGRSRPSRRPPTDARHVRGASAGPRRSSPRGVPQRSGGGGAQPPARCRPVRHSARATGAATGRASADNIAPRARPPHRRASPGQWAIAPRGGRPLDEGDRAGGTTPGGGGPIEGAGHRPGGRRYGAAGTAPTSVWA